MAGPFFFPPFLSLHPQPNSSQIPLPESSAYCAYNIPIMSEPYNIALLGCGTVGTGVARLLLEQPERLAARAGRPLALRRVVVKHIDKPRDVRLPPGLQTDNLQTVLKDPGIHAAVE